MAKNRMFLVHLPTGFAVHLGKRGGYGWSQRDPSSLGERVEKLFSVLEKEYQYAEAQDDFALTLEDDSDATVKISPWAYGSQREDGLVQLVLENNKTSVGNDGQ